MADTCDSLKTKFLWTLKHLKTLFRIDNSVLRDLGFNRQDKEHGYLFDAELNVIGKQVILFPTFDHHVVTSEAF